MRPLLSTLTFSALFVLAAVSVAGAQDKGKEALDQATDKKLTAESRLNIDFDFFEMLHRAGQRAGRRFLDAHFDDIGVRSTIDLREEMKAEKSEAMPAGVDRLSK